MSEARPDIVILAGAEWRRRVHSCAQVLPGALGVNEFVNADVIARSLSAFDPVSDAVPEEKRRFADWSYRRCPTCSFTPSAAN